MKPNTAKFNEPIWDSRNSDEPDFPNTKHKTKTHNITKHNSMPTLEEVRKASAESGEVNDLPSNLPIPKDRYCFRIKEGSSGPAKKSGNNQLTFKCELYYPATIIHPADKKEYNIAGKELSIYKPLTGKSLEHTLLFMEQIGLKPEIADLENPDLKQFEGKCFSMIAESKEMTPRKELTPEQVAAGKEKWEADPILDEDGKATISYGIAVAGFGDIRPTKKVAPASPY